MIKHVFCDLDGTLLHDFKDIHMHDLEAINQFVKQGTPFSIATGRINYDVTKIQERIRLPWYAITQNGAVIHNEKNDVIYMNSLNNESILEISKILENEPCIVFYETSEAYICLEKHDIVKQVEQNSDYVVYIENPNILDELDQHKISSISLWIEEEKIVGVLEKLRNVLPEDICAYLSSAVTIDITKIENSKGNAIKFIANLLDLKPEEIAVIGDSQNDVSMFEYTRNSYVMHTASDNVKDQATYCVKTVKEALEQIKGA